LNVTSPYKVSNPPFQYERTWPIVNSKTCKQQHPL